MIPALFLLGGLFAGLGIFGYAWKITSVDDALADVDAPIDYYPNDHPGWQYLAAAVNAETPLYDQVVVEREMALLEAAWALPPAEVDR